MAEPKKSENDHIAEAKAKLLEAAIPEVVFDGWSQATLDFAIINSNVDPALAALAVPRGVIDLAVAYHKAGDDQMMTIMHDTDLERMRYRDRVIFAVKTRLRLAEKESVRRGVSLFALPQHASDGASALWGTADGIWNALGDTSADVNWYTKRATLSAVYSATVLFWLGDTSEGDQATWDFLDRRIENVMQIETLKAKARDVPFVKAFMAGPGRILDKVHKPSDLRPADLPGFVSEK